MAGSVQLDDRVEGRIDRLVASGRFASREAVVEAAVDLIPADDDWFRMVERKVSEGRAQIAAGQGIDIDEAFDAVLARLGRA